MAPKIIRPDRLAEVLPPGGLTWLQACSAESALLRDGIVAAGDRLGPMTFTGIFVPGLNRLDYLVQDRRRAKTFFLTPELRRRPDATEFLPFNYREIIRHLYATPISAALFMVSPPDENGLCGVGPVADFVPDFWKRIPIRIAHVNPRLPETRGYAGIPWEELTAVVEGEQDLPTSQTGAPDAVTEAIGRHVAAIVPDRATIQTGLGRVPDAALRGLADHRNLRIHSGLIGDAVVDLLEAGAIAPGLSITTGVAIGTARLYEAVADDRFRFRPAVFTHSPKVITTLQRFVTINSVVEIDLLANGFAEHQAAGLMSGPGGASDFASAGRANDAIRIIVLPSTADGGRTSRIVPTGANPAPVSLNRFDIDVVVTEHGAADLRLKSHHERAEALIAVAAPAHRPMLEESWGRWTGRFWQR
ncbi:acetyl-CoA hydrolase/transferase family protein [Neoaquamicrobium microcysteis]|uniref:acetyl-CoA hydrolase/transferase family protein n=1 Tax=Neoaquamicrobium microcysteis TaxID=2682781 RepID=UPI001375A31F|nr:acetyl-CoA hydrolase/transferase C-terminal domain-containing protein [Mesorhizobium microcysteis]